jgi:hypothetical protein
LDFGVRHFAMIAQRAMVLLALAGA